MWVNSASNPGESDITLPAVVRCGELTLAVSTGGAAPALARRIREKWEAEFDAVFAEWVCILAEVRAEVLAKVADRARRRQLLDSFADWHWLACFAPKVLMPCAKRCGRVFTVRSDPLMKFDRWAAHKRGWVAGVEALRRPGILNQFPQHRGIEDSAPATQTCTN